MGTPPSLSLQLAQEKTNKSATKTKQLEKCNKYLTCLQKTIQATSVEDQEQEIHCNKQKLLQGKKINTKLPVLRKKNKPKLPISPWQ